ncbi:MAG: hypothetical protein AAF732_20405 [Pseudomonadota bacterium]
MTKKHHRPAGRLSADAAEVLGPTSTGIENVEPPSCIELIVGSEHGCVALFHTLMLVDAVHVE